MADMVDLELDLDDHLRHVRPLVDPLDEFDSLELYRRFRFDRRSLSYLTDLIRPALTEFDSLRNRPIPPTTQLTAALSYLASNSYQQTVGDTLHITQSSVSRIVSRVATALCERVPDVIRLPADDAARRGVMAGFYGAAGFPGVVGCIDGTHVHIVAPSDDATDYLNRKRRYSINVQGVCDHRGRFINLVARWPGSAHDAWVLRQSQLWAAFEAGQAAGILLGDSGYPCRRWLMTPYANPNAAAQRRFNESHRRTRVLIEQTFGRWKRRFGILQQTMRLRPAKVVKIIGACAVLHNLAIDLAQPDPDDADDEEDNQQPDPIVYNGPLNAGNAYRNHLAQAHFAA